MKAHRLDSVRSLTSSQGDPFLLYLRSICPPETFAEARFRAFPAHHVGWDGVSQGISPQIDLNCFAQQGQGQG
jgi:hypothetical protein